MDFSRSCRTGGMDQLRQSLLEAPIIEKGEYEYFVHPISDGVPMLEPGLLREIVIKIIRKADLEDVDKIVTPAAMGIHISTAVSLMTDIPLVVIRKRSTDSTANLTVQEPATPRAKCTSTTCTRATGPRPRRRALDRRDAGRTYGALEDIGADIRDIVCVIKKADGTNKLDEAGYDAKTLINVRSSTARSPSSTSTATTRAAVNTVP